MVKINISHFGGARGADELVVYDKGERTATNKFGWEACIKDGRAVCAAETIILFPKGATWFPATVKLPHFWQRKYVSAQW